MNTTSPSILAFLLTGILTLIAHADPGKEIVGKLKGTVVYASNDSITPPAESNPLFTSLASGNEDLSLAFETFQELGTDTQVVYKAYENWLKPIKESDKIMLSYDCKVVTHEGVKLAITFWQDSIEVFSTEVFELSKNTPLIITGPDWRDGKILIAVELLNK